MGQAFDFAEKGSLDRAGEGELGAGDRPLEDVVITGVTVREL